MLNSGISTTIIGFDVCLGEAALNKDDMDVLLSSGKEEAVFSVQCNRSLLEYNLQRSNEHMVDLPDAVAWVLYYGMKLFWKTSYVTAMCVR